jgi:hypothetical protein
LPAGPLFSNLEPLRGTLPLRRVRPVSKGEPKWLGKHRKSSKCRSEWKSTCICARPASKRRANRAAEQPLRSKLRSPVSNGGAFLLPLLASPTPLGKRSRLTTSTARSGATLGARQERSRSSCVNLMVARPEALASPEGPRPGNTAWSLASTASDRRLAGQYRPYSLRSHRSGRRRLSRRRSESDPPCSSECNSYSSRIESNLSAWRRLSCSGGPPIISLPRIRLSRTCAPTR